MAKLSRLLGGLFSILILALAPFAAAQRPIATLSSVFPPGGKQGSQFDVKISGSDLDDAGDLIFSHEGITAEIKMEEPSDLSPAPLPVENTFLVSIAGDVPPGIYEARTVGRFGVSNPRSFMVGTLNELTDDGGNKSLENAREVEIGTVINGQVDGSGVDYFKLNLKEGQRVLIECFARRLDSRMDATLVIYDQQGRELTKNRDAYREDALIDFTSPADGTFIVGLYDFIYGGGNEYFYRLAIHDRPHVDFVFPPSGQPGTSGSYAVYGRNLPGGKPDPAIVLDGSPLERVDVQISVPGDEMERRQLDVGSLAEPRTALLDAFEYRMENANPVRIGFARGPVIAEQEPNGDPASATKVTAPCEVVGQFYPALDEDWIELEARQGDIYYIEVISHRIGLVTSDPFLLIQRVTKNDKGEEQIGEVTAMDDPADRNNKIGGDFDISTDDPEYRLEVKEDGLYRLLVRDQFNSVIADPRNVYRLVIRKAEPDFRLVALAESEATGNQNIVAVGSTVLRKGGTAMLTVKAERRDGFDGEIQIAAEGLPAGVSCAGAILGPAMESAPLVFVAEEGAAAWSGPIEIVGQAGIGGQEAIRHARGGAAVWGTTNRNSVAPEYRLTRDLALSVMDAETEPVLIQIGEQPIYETSRGANLEIPIKLARRDEFKLDVKLVAQGVPNELKPGDVTIKGNDTDGTLKFTLNNNNLKPGSYTFVMQGQVQKYDYQRNPEAIQRTEELQKHLDELIKKVNEEIKQAQGAKDDAKVKELQEKLKAATDKKKQVDGNLNNLKKDAKKQINLFLTSTPVLLRIAASPINLAAVEAGAIKQGEKKEIEVSVEKLYGFDENVEVSLELPGGVSGISGKLTIKKGESQGKLTIDAAKNATPGEHTIKLKATSKFNNVNVESTSDATLKIEEVKE